MKTEISLVKDARKYKSAKYADLVVGQAFVWSTLSSEFADSWANLGKGIKLNQQVWFNLKNLQAESLDMASTQCYCFLLTVESATFKVSEVLE